AVKVVRSLPGGQIFTATSQRTATLATPTDLFSLQTLTDSWTINGQSANRVYDAATRTMTATSAEGRKVIGVLDAKGRLISRTLATGLAPYQFTYDSKGLIVEVKQGAQYWTLAYDAQDRLITRSDAAGQTIGYGYDSSNRLVQQTLPSGIMYQYSYDANGNRTHVILPGGNDHALGYAADGLFNSYAPPGNGSYTRTFDADRRLTRTTLPAGRFAERTFDANARILQIAYPEVTQTFEYFTNDKTDRARRIIQTPASGPAQEMLYSYNGSLVGSITASGAAPAQVTYAYNNDLLPTSMQLVSGADTVTTALAWDKDGAGTGFGPFTLTRAGPGGALSKISDGGLNVTYVYDTLGRITSRTHTVGNVAVYSAQLTYGISGRIASRTETIGGVSHSQVYTYDLDGRLTGVQRDGVADEIYAYDVRGNRTSRTIGAGAAQVATYDAQDRLQQRATVTYVVNADGFLAQRGADTFQYSTRGQLLQATVGGQPITYAYDGLGRRVSRTTAAGTYEFLYGDPASHLVTAVRDTDGQLTTLYYDSVGLLFALQRGAARYYVATDQVGTPRVVTDNAGVIVKQLEFDTFGVELTDTAPGFDLPIGYAGGIADAPTGLVHFGFRDYEPASGRWTARDPALFDGGQGNLFAYVDNNPVGNRDPTGLICVSVTMYKGYGGGTQTCIGLEGASVCAEIGVGAGGGIGVDLLGVGTGGLGLFGGPLDKTGVVTENAEAVLECGPFEVGAAAALSMEGCFSAGFKSSLEFQEALKNRVKGDSYYFAEFFKGKCKLEAKWNAKTCWSEKW
ncbi:MAG: RHS repeat protein, partial [Burkholderiales bacterium]|nr:RHS repeat protein [Burkholderiales bacterium]